MVTSRFAESLEASASRYEEFGKTDPFPSIPAALLNSADIIDYVATTGMIYPFSEDASHLKPASYEVALAGDYVFWDETGARQESKIEKGKPFTLKANSIAFVSLEPYFRIPDYIAIRFNLRITHIYQGILLGTGPLVDPGYVGWLSLPLHNLTTNDYELMGGDGLIWMEFTKLSPAPTLNHVEESHPRQGDFYPLEESKTGDLRLSDYLHKAAPGRPIRSAIPDIAESARRLARESEASAKRSERATERTRNFIQGALVITVILGFLSAAGVIATLWSLWAGTNSRIDSLVEPSTELEAEKVRETLRDLQSRIGVLEDWRVIALVLSLLFAVMASIGVLALIKGRPESSENGTSSSSVPP